MGIERVESERVFVQTFGAFRFHVFGVFLSQLFDMTVRLRFQVDTYRKVLGIIQVIDCIRRDV